MFINHSDIIRSILEVGIALHENGIHNWVLTKDQAVGAVEEFRKNNIALLGGDTYLDGLINPNGDSWSVERYQNESDQDYINRSLRQGLEFICNPIYQQYSFILVPRQ